MKYKKQLWILAIAGILIIALNSALFPCLPKPIPVSTNNDIAIILGYDYFLLDQQNTENYVDKIIPDLQRQKNLQGIVVSGGHSHPDISKKSEAQVLAETLLKRGINIPIIIEGRSLSTKQNLEFTNELLHTYEIPDRTKLIIFYDLTKYASVHDAAKKSVWGYDIDFRAVNMNTLHLHKRILKLEELWKKF